MSWPEFTALVDHWDKQTVELYFTYYETPFIRQAAFFIAKTWPHLFWVIPTFALYIYRKRRAALSFFICLGLAVALNSHTIDRLKKGVGRERPVDYLGIEPDTRPGSFPSAHAGNMFCIATVYLLYMPATSILVTTMAATIALSRFFSLSHYPSDIISGALIGIAHGLLAFMLLALLRRLLSKAWPDRNAAFRRPALPASRDFHRFR